MPHQASIPCLWRNTSTFHLKEIFIFGYSASFHSAVLRRTWLFPLPVSSLQLTCRAHAPESIHWCYHCLQLLQIAGALLATRPGIARVTGGTWQGCPHRSHYRVSFCPGSLPVSVGFICTSRASCAYFGREARVCFPEKQSLDSLRTGVLSAWPLPSVHEADCPPLCLKPQRPFTCYVCPTCLQLLPNWSQQ